MVNYVVRYGEGTAPRARNHQNHQPADYLNSALKQLPHYLVLGPSVGLG